MSEVLHKLLDKLREQQSFCPYCGGEVTCRMECPLEGLWFPDDKKNLLTCDDCGTTEGVESTTCPYQSEIYNEEVPADLCGDCYQERVWDT